MLDARPATSEVASVLPDLTSDQIRDAARAFDQACRDTGEWDAWEDNAAHKFALVLDGRRYPVKKVLSLASGVPVSSFSGGQESNRFLAARGFVVQPLERSVQERPMPGVSRHLQLILDEYVRARTETPFSGSNEVAGRFRDLGRSLEESDVVRARTTLKVVPSYGKGNWAKVPWLSLLDSRETMSTKAGVYVVYLFRQDMSGVYLTLNQGVTEPRTQHGAEGARSVLARRAVELRRQGSDLASRGFQLDDGIDLRADAGLGSSYEGSTAAYKLYESGQIPSDEELLADLEAILVAYDRYLQARPDAATPTEQSAWIFQANPEIYDLSGAVKGLHELLWVVRQHGSRIHKDDRVYLWEAGPDAGVVAIATVTEGPANLPAIAGEEPFRRDKEALGDGTEKQVRLRIDRVLPSRLRRDSLRAHPTLGSLTILRAPVGTNFAVTAEQGRALDLLLAGPAAEVKADPRDAQSVLDAIRARGFVYEPWQVATYITALRTKPFVILAGVTGTGKSKLPDLVAEATGGVPQLIPVRPDWTDSSEVLGYVDLQGAFRPGALLSIARRALEDPDRHYVCIVDEMNLARVEHYFAEVLSRIEDRRRSDTGGFVSGQLFSGALRPEDSAWGRVGLPANLAIVGTVNMDESTHGFSRKVLDRAFTLELSEVDLANWEAAPAPGRLASIWPVESWYPRALQLSSLSSPTAEDRDLIAGLIGHLTEINVILGAAQLQLGYRSRDEIGLFLINARSLQALFTTSAGEAVDPLDLAFNLKVLPRIVGGTGPVRRALIELLGWAWDGKPLSQEEDAEALLDRWRGEGRPSRLRGARFPFTAGRLCLMWGRLLADGYTSFWL
jgi:hypothetical protein